VKTNIIVRLPMKGHFRARHRREEEVPMIRHSAALLLLLGSASLSLAGFDTYFENKLHDFGATPRGPQLVHYFRFTNSGKEPLVITNVRVSCGCVTASAPVTTIKPGESSYITAQMDSRRFTGPKSVTVYVQFSQPRFEEVSLLVTANGREDFSMSPDSLALGNIKKGADAKATMKVTLLSDPAWEIKEAKCDSNYVQVAAKLLKRERNEVTYEITATVRPDLPVGKWFTDVHLVTTNAALLKVRVPLTVDVNPAVSVTPLAVSLGDIRMGESSEQRLLVKGDKPFKIKNINGADDTITVTGAGTEAKIVHILNVVVKPTKVGAISKDLALVTDEGDEAINVPVRANAIKE